MVDFYGVLNAPTTKLSEAVKGWSDAIDKLGQVKDDMATQVVRPVTSSGWKGESASAGIAFMKKVAGEVEDAAAQATGIRDVLREAYTAIKDARKQLRDIVETEAAEQGLAVGTDGTVSLRITRADGGASRPGPTAEEQEKIAALEDRIKRIVRTASEADALAAWALRANVGKDAYDFSSPKHESLDEAERAQAAADADTVLRLAREDDPSDKDLTRLNKLLAAHRNDPAFAERVAVGMGPKGALDFYANAGALYQAVPTEERRRLMGGIQRNLGTTLATATRSDSPAMESWEREMVGLGSRPVGRTPGVYGFQVMSNLMRYGTYEKDFLLDYGKALLAVDKKSNLSGGLLWTDSSSTGDLNFTGESNDRGRDPVTGFLEGLGHNPGAATEFFNSGDNFDYLTGTGQEGEGLPYRNRVWPVDDFRETGTTAAAGYASLGHALEAATMGYAYDDPTPQLHRDGDTSDVMDKVVQAYGSDASYMHTQPGMNESLGRMAAAYIDDLNYAIEDYGDTNSNIGDTVFPAQHDGRRDFERGSSIKFLSVLGQDMTAHGTVSAAQHLYTLNQLDQYPPTSAEQWDRAKTTMHVGVQVRGVLDEAGANQSDADWAGMAEEANKERGKSRDWIKFGVGSTIGASVAMVPTTAAGPVGVILVPIASETVGGAVETWVGQKIDDSSEQGNVDYTGNAQYDRRQFRDATVTAFKDIVEGYFAENDIPSRQGYAGETSDVLTRDLASSYDNTRQEHKDDGRPPYQGK